MVCSKQYMCRYLLLVNRSITGFNCCTCLALQEGKSQKVIEQISFLIFLVQCPVIPQTFLNEISELRKKERENKMNSRFTRRLNVMACKLCTSCSSQKLQPVVTLHISSPCVRCMYLNLTPRYVNKNILHAWLLVDPCVELVLPQQLHHKGKSC